MAGILFLLVTLNYSWFTVWEALTTFNSYTNCVYYYHYFIYSLLALLSSICSTSYTLHCLLCYLFGRFPNKQLVFLSKVKAELWHSMPHLFVAWLSTLQTHVVINNTIAKSHQKALPLTRLPHCLLSLKHQVKQIYLSSLSLSLSSLPFPSLNVGTKRGRERKVN